MQTGSEDRSITRMCRMRKMENLQNSRLGEGPATDVPPCEGGGKQELTATGPRPRAERAKRRPTREDEGASWRPPMVLGGQLNYWE